MSRRHQRQSGTVREQAATDGLGEVAVARLAPARRACAFAPVRMSTRCEYSRRGATSVQYVGSVRRRRCYTLCLRQFFAPTTRRIHWEARQGQVYGAYVNPRMIPIGMYTCPFERRGTGEEVRQPEPGLTIYKKEPMRVREAAKYMPRRDMEKEIMLYRYRGEEQAQERGVRRGSACGGRWCCAARKAPAQAARLSGSSSGSCAKCRCYRQAQGV